MTPAKKYARIEKPTTTQLYALRARDVRRTPATVGDLRLTVVERVAEDGCFVDGHRRVYSVELPFGNWDVLGGRLGPGATAEVLAWAPTRAAALREAVKVYNARYPKGHT